MDINTYKAQLIEILREAQNINDTDIEIIPNTNIKVRKGRSEEFKSLAYLFYQDYKKENNIIELEGSQDNYLTNVYDILKIEVNEILDEDSRVIEEDLLANAFSLAEEILPLTERFKRVKAGLDNISRNYEKISKQAADLQSRLSSMEYSVWKTRFDEINASIADYAENREIVTKTLVNIKNEINAKFIETLDKEMARLREEFTKHPKNTPTFSKDGYSILPEHEEAYNSLVDLKEMLSNVKDSTEIVLVNDILCVNVSEKDKANSLLGKIDNFKYLQPKGINTKLIEDIKKEMASLAEPKLLNKAYEEMPNGVIVKRVNKDRYLNLIEMLKILNRADASDKELESVWGIAHVLPTDIADLKKLMRQDEVLKANDPDTKAREFNDKMIKELEEYLVELEKNFIDYKSYTNIPSRKTSRDTIVLADDFDEYEAVCQMIIYLKMNNNLANNRSDLVNVWGLGYLSDIDNEITEYKKLINSTKKYSEKAPKIAENDKIIEQIKKELIALNERAKNTPNPILADNKTVLLEDEEEYNLLISKLKYLEASKDSVKLEEINDGAKIASEYAGYYRNINGKLEDIRKNKTPNKLKLQEVDNKIRSLDASKEEDKEKLEVLNKLKGILLNAEKSTDLVDVDGIKVAKDDEQAYKELIEKLASLEKAPDHPEKSKNEIKLAEVEKELDTLKSADMSDSKKVDKQKALTTIKDILNNAEKSNDLVEVDGVKIDRNDEENYRNATKVLKELDKPKKASFKDKAKALRSKIKIRGLKEAAKEWWKNNKKTVAAIGLTILAIGVGAALLGQPIIYACSYIAAHNTALAPAMTGIVNNLCNAGFANMVNGAVFTNAGQLLSGNFMISRSLKHLAFALAGAGIVGLDAYFIKKYLKSEDEERLPDLNPDNKKKITDKLGDLLDKIKGKFKGRDKDEELEELGEELEKNNEIDLSANEAKIAEIEAKLAKVEKQDLTIPENQQLKINLETMRNVLKYSLTAKDLEEVEGVLIAHSLKDTYIGLVRGIENIEKSLGKVDSIVEEISGNVAKQIEADAQARVQQRVNDITAEAKNNPAVANVVGAQAPAQPAAQAPEINTGEILENLGGDHEIPALPPHEVKPEEDPDKTKYYQKDDEELYPEVESFVKGLDNVTVSVIQRQFKLGYSKAARLMDMLEARGIIGPYNGSGPREVLGKEADKELQSPVQQAQPPMSPEEIAKMMGSGTSFIEEQSQELTEAEQALIANIKAQIEENQAKIDAGTLSEEEVKKLEADSQSKRDILDMFENKNKGFAL
ncbi:MAG: hypothetical protein NC483_03520 [Ruminococcus sp.]|nr:hypothetical protein [Ruminococcus sp.]